MFGTVPEFGLAKRNRYCGEAVAGDGLRLIADRVGVVPGGGGLCTCPGGSSVKFGEKRADFLEGVLRLLISELPELLRVWPGCGEEQMRSPVEGPLRVSGTPFRGSCRFNTPGVLKWRGVLGRGRLEEY